MKQAGFRRDVEERREAILALRNDGFVVEEMNRLCQYRINGELDIYPKSRKWHDVKRNARGIITRSIKGFVMAHLFVGIELRNKLCASVRRDLEKKRRPVPSAEQIEAMRTPNGGWTRKQLEEWGVEWPPKKGWKSELESHFNTQQV